ncbi:hypothetical protein ACSBR2_014179 [Camellia fascicularis]
MEGLTDEERRALRGSKFAPLPPSASSPSRSKPKPRLPHLDGPLTTNKAAALVKFLERKLQEPNGLASIKPELVELAVKNAQDTVNASNYQLHLVVFFPNGVKFLYSRTRLWTWLNLVKFVDTPFFSLCAMQVKFMTYKPYIHDPTQNLIFLRRVFLVGLYVSNLV